MSGPLSIWVVSDGRAGIENQALGLAQAVGRRAGDYSVTVRRVRWRPIFDWLPAGLKTRAMLDPSSDPLDPPWPDLLVATGRASLPISLGMRRWSGGATFVVQTQNPRVDPARFDLVVAPAHDGLSGADVLSITGSPNRVTPDELARSAAEFPHLSDLPAPRIAVLIGGRSKAFDLPTDRAAAMADDIAQTVRTAGGSLMLTFSRRTPADARTAMTRRLADVPGVIWDGEGANPLFAFLHAADHILVTEDSASMAAEAASTGRPVHILPMTPLRPPGKFARLHADLEARGAARPFDGKLEGWSYEPLAETDRAAREILRRMAAR